MNMKSVLLLCFLTLFLAVGLFVIFFSVKEELEAREAKQWPVVSGVVIESSVSLSSNDTYDFEIKYRYEFKDVEFVCDRYAFHWIDTGNREIPDSLKRSYPVGANIDVYVNPNNPEKAVINVDRSNRYWFLVLLGLAFIIIPSLMVLVIIRE